MPVPPFFAVRVVIEHDSGTSTRDYVRGNWSIGKDRFLAFAVGDMVRVVGGFDEVVKIRYEEVDFNTVRENRQYDHTTHGSVSL